MSACVFCVLFCWWFGCTMCDLCVGVVVLVALCVWMWCCCLMFCCGLVGTSSVCLLLYVGFAVVGLVCCFGICSVI